MYFTVFGLLCGVVVAGVAYLLGVWSERRRWSRVFDTRKD